MNKVTFLCDQIGDRADSTSYIKAKSKAANEVIIIHYFYGTICTFEIFGTLSKHEIFSY
jgi:hypothetical protein